MSLTLIKSFNYLENGEVMFSEHETVKTTKKLESGTYSLVWLDHPHYRVGITQTHQLEELRIPVFAEKDKVDVLFNSFNSPKTHRILAKLGILNKNGVLFYGREGTGKSSIVKYYSEMAIKHNNAIVFHVSMRNIHSQWNFIKSVRQIQDNPIIVFMDEIDSYMKDYEDTLKKFMDGVDSINNCFFFGCTNYLDRIPNAIQQRPSRFKYTISIDGVPNEEAVKSIVEPLLNTMYSDDDINEISYSLVGKTIDVIKQYCLDKLMGVDHFTPGKEKLGFTK